MSRNLIVILTFNASDKYCLQRTKVLFGLKSGRKLNGEACSTTWDKSEIHTNLWPENLSEATLCKTSKYIGF
jgi:hypothetical protein